MLSQRLISALVATDFANQYYAFCQLYPYRNEPACKCPHPEVLKALEGLGEVKKLGGPGRVYVVRIPGQNAGMEFGFVIQGQGTSVEACLNFTDSEQVSGGNFVIMAFDAIKAEGKVMPNPPYPRPSFHSPSELREIVGFLLELALKVGQVFYAKPD